MADIHEDNLNSITSALKIIIQRYKASPDSPELLKAISHLSIASKAYNSIIDDAFILLGCRSINGGGCSYARDKLYGYIRSSNATKFIACADLIFQQYHQSEYIHIFTKYLIDIVEKCSYEFLVRYINFLTCNKMIQQYYHFRQEGKYPGFKPLVLVKALQIANENGWADKALFLFKHLIGYYSPPDQIYPECHKRTEEVCAEISKNTNLNFDGQLGNRIRNIWTQSDLKCLFETLLVPKRIELSSSRAEELLSLPIEQQPWFFGHLEDPKRITSDCSTAHAFFVVFKGSELKVHLRGLYSAIDFQPRYIPRYSYYISNGGIARYAHLYHFYRSLVEQDLDTLKLIQETHRINWSDLGIQQPNPFLELLSKVSEPREEIIQYLVDIGVPKVLSPWPYRVVQDGQVLAFEKLLSAGAKIDSELFTQLLKRPEFMNRKQMQRLIDAWIIDRDITGRVMSYVLHQYPQILETSKVKFKFSDRKLTVLCIYKYGQSDGCNYLQTLPKELIRVIIEFMNEEPLFYDLALSIMKTQGIEFAYFPTIGDFQRSPYYGRIIMEGSNMELKRHTMEYFINNMNFKIIRQNYYWIRRAICEQEPLHINLQLRKLISFIMKYEMDIAVFRNLHRHFEMPKEWPFIEAFKTKNRTALQFYIFEQKTFEMPSRAFFERKFKPPKYNMTYEQALALIDEINTNSVITH